MTTTAPKRPVVPTAPGPSAAPAAPGAAPASTVAARRTLPARLAAVAAAASRAVVESPIGPLVVAGDDRALTHLLLPPAAGNLPPAPSPAPGAPVAEAVRQLHEYFAGRRRTFELPVAPQGTAFALTVWRTLAEIPYGETISYAELARWVGRPGAARAVGQANGANPLAIVLPCHRVVASGGGLGGYGGGLDAKRALLALERAGE